MSPAPASSLLVDAPAGRGRGRAASSPRCPGSPTPSVAARPALVTAQLAAAADDDAVAEAALDAFADAPRRHRRRRRPSPGLQIGETVGEDLGRAELIAFPFLLVLSLLFFRGRATLLPLAVGVTTVLGTFLVLTAVNQVYGLSVFALNLVIGLGLGLAIDYTLFLVTRYREELAARGATPGAIRATMATAGPHRRLLGRDRRRRADHADRLPAGLPQVDGHRRRDRRASSPPLAALVIAPALFALWGAKLARKGGADAAEAAAAGTGSPTPSCAARALSPSPRRAVDARASPPRAAPRSGRPSTPP